MDWPRINKNSTRDGTNLDPDIIWRCLSSNKRRIHGRSDPSLRSRKDKYPKRWRPSSLFTRANLSSIQRNKSFFPNRWDAARKGYKESSLGGSRVFLAAQKSNPFKSQFWKGIALYGVVCDAFREL